MNEAKVFGAFLRQIRIEKGATLGEASQACGLNYDNYGRYELATRHPPSPKMVKRFIEGLNLNEIEAAGLKLLAYKYHEAILIQKWR